MRLRTLTALVALAAALAACASMDSRVRGLKLGMSRDAVVKLLGDEFEVLAARLEADGIPVEVMQYPREDRAPLLLFFRADQLVQWGDDESLKLLVPQ